MLEKQQIRREIMQKRRHLAADDRHAAAQALANHVAQTPQLFANKVIALFSPIKDEIDLTPLHQALKPQAGIMALPCVMHDEVMVFKAWDGQHTKPDNINIPTGTGDEVVPDVVFVPFLGFNRACHRLGYGAGYYDKTLVGLPMAHTIGLGFSVQEYANIPVELHDVPLNEIWTEKERIYAPKN